MLLRRSPFAEQHMAAEQRNDSQQDQRGRSDGSAVIYKERDKETDGEGYPRREKPAADDGKYARNAEYGGIASPGAVGKRAAHSDHERYVRGGKRELQGSAQGDQQTGHDQVHGGAHQVKSGAVGYNGLVLAETGVYPLPGPLRNPSVQAVGNVQAQANHLAGYRRTAETLFAFFLAGEVDRRPDDMLRLTGGEQRIHHDGARACKEIPGSFCRPEQRRHQEVVGSGPGSLRNEIGVCRITGQRHPDEVDQVISGKGQRQGKRSQQHDDLENIHLQPVQHLHQEGKEDETVSHKRARMPVYPQFILRRHERTVFQPLDDHEIENGRRRESAEQPDGVFHLLPVAKREEHAGQILYQHTEEKGDGHGYEYGHDHGERLIRIDQLSHLQAVVGENLDHGDGERTPKQFKHHGYRRRGRQTHGVESVQQNDVGDHDGKDDAHDLGKVEVLGLVNAVTGNVHHAVGERGAGEYANGGNDHDQPE